MLTYEKLRRFCSDKKGVLLSIRTFASVEWEFINDGGEVCTGVLKEGLISIRENGISEWTGQTSTYASLTPKGVRELRKLCATNP